uniref:Peptidase A1 domain-containing protein n=1 Tax=Panagrellus redivivus TaxID=6233 RepID=A0A7E4V7J3_PANRE
MNVDWFVAFMFQRSQHKAGEGWRYTKIEFGFYQNRKPVQVISDSSGTWIGAPEADVNAIVNQTGAIYDEFYEIYVVNFNAPVPYLVFTIGRHKYSVPASQYIFDYSIGNGKCAVAVCSFMWGGSGPQWDLGTAFLRCEFLLDV